MALAYLLHQVSVESAKGTGGVRCKLTALIVDHGVRPGSDKEAATVAKSLESLGIRAKIISLNEVVRNAPHIEGDLREKRYRALVDEAVKQGIQYLFAGHHLDDQVETLLTRLIRDIRLNPLSFAGIAPEALVPCSQNVMRARFTTTNLANMLSSHTPSSARFNQGPVSSTDRAAKKNQIDGIRLLRPLLDHRKRDLVAFCALHNIPVVTDQTNFDPTITTRNTLRYMRSRHSLPAALSEQNMIRVRTSVLQMRSSIIKSAEQLAQGSLVRFWNSDRSAEITLPRIPNLDTPEVQRAIAWVITRMAEAVSPTDDANIPELLAPEDLLLDNLGQNQTTTRLKVQINRFKLGSASRITYGLHRQRMDLSERRAQTRKFVWKSPDNSMSLDNSDEAPASETEWMHWDNRFWISLTTTRSSITDRLSIRPFHDKLDADLIRVLRENRAIPPASTRQGVPVLCLDEKVVALPTRGFWLNKELSLQLSYRVRYTVPPRTSELLVQKSVRDSFSAEISASVQQILQSSLEQNSSSTA